MNVAVINNYYYLRGGSERVLFAEKQLLEENDVEVVPFSRAHPKNEHSKYADYFLPIIDYENLSVLKKMWFALNIIYNNRIGRTFMRLLEEIQPHIIHAHNIYGGLTTSIIDAAQKKGIPVVMTVHDYKLICPSYLSLNHGIVCEDCRNGRFYHCLLNRCHKNTLFASTVYTAESYYNKWLRKYDSIRFLICPSRFLQSKLLDNGFSPERLIYLPNFIDFRSFMPSYDVGDYLLYVGRLSKEKGVMTLLKAVKKSNMQVKIIGDGPMKAELVAFVRDNKMSHVTFKGYKSGEELKELYQNAAFLVIPSEWYENAPMTILEAFAYGKPVIGSRIGGIPEMIEPNKTGMLFEVGNIDQLDECVQKLWSNKTMISNMGFDARNKVEMEFSSQKHVHSLLEIYRRALN